MPAFAKEYTHVRTEELVSRAHQEIAVERADIDGTVRRVVDCVNVSYRAALMGNADDLLHVVNRAHRIRSVADRNQFRAIGNLARQIVHVESAIVFMNLRHANGHAALFERAPRRNIGIVIKVREHDFVPRTELAPNRAANGESQRSHVGTENDLIRITAQEIRDSRPRAGDHRVGAATGRVSAACVSVVMLQIIGDRIDNTLWNLSSARPIEERCGMAVNGLRERRELRANPIKIKCICCFVLSTQHRIHKDL